jgi:hypothetical protein
MGRVSAYKVPTLTLKTPAKASDGSDDFWSDGILVVSIDTEDAAPLSPPTPSTKPHAVNPHCLLWLGSVNIHL